MCHALMIVMLMIVEYAVFILGSITLPDKKIKSNNYQRLFVGCLINILAYFFYCDILFGPKDTVP